MLNPQRVHNEMTVESSVPNGARTGVGGVRGLGAMLGAKKGC